MVEITRVVTLKAAPEKVYAWVSQPEHLCVWFCEVATQVNERLTFKWTMDDGSVSGFDAEIIQNDAPHAFAYRSLDSDLLTTRFEVRRDGDSTRLALQETGFGDHEAGQQLLKDHSTGWDWFFSRLQDLDR